MPQTTLLPGPASLQLERVVASAYAITMIIRTTAPLASCSLCGQASDRVHSRYVRILSDLPWQGVRVRMHLHTRRFFCRHPDCPRHIFTERLPSVVAPYARRTARLQEMQCLLGLALGGEAGARVLDRLAMGISPDTVRRLIRRAALVNPPSPRVIGVDDWAWRKGQRYGTILVDLEHHRPVDLLPDHEATTLAAWLKGHPGIEIITRDRANYYAEGATQGAPQAMQIADRFHLLKNLTEAVERFLGRHHALLREAARRASPHYLSEPVLKAEGSLPTLLPDTRPPRSRRDALKKQQNRERRQARYESVKQLRQEGLSISAIGRRLGMHRETVRTFLRADTFPERAPAYRRVGPITRFVDYLMKRWCEGCFNATQLGRR